MHEAAITQALVDQVRVVVPEGSRLELCRIEVGELEHLDVPVMQTIWRAMIEDTELAGAVLEIERIPLRVRCRACKVEFVPEDNSILICPGCDAVRPEVLSGAGVTLRAVEVEEN